MSHFTTVKTRILDVEALEQSLYQLDFKVIHKARIQGWQGRQKKAALVAQIGDCPYDIGFVKDPQTQHYNMVADWWALQQATGVGEQEWADRVTQRYAYNKILKEVAKQGFLVAQDQVTADQSIRLVVRKW